MKISTDLEQSKKLAEFLPLESADMRYAPIGDIHPWVWEGNPKLLETDSTPCWSLSALLGVLPETMLGKDKNGYVVMAETMGSGLVTTSNNSIDACYEMIIKLHEQNLL